MHGNINLAHQLDGFVRSLARRFHVEAYTLFELLFISRQSERNEATHQQKYPCSHDWAVGLNNCRRVAAQVI